MQQNNVAYRGNILRVTSTSDSRYTKHVGNNYWLVRVCGDRDTNLAGDKVGPMRYGYNLVNTNDGKARVTDKGRLFVTEADGIERGIPLYLLEQHFGMRFRLITSERVIAPEVNHAVQAEANKNDQQQNILSLARGIAALLGTGLLAQRTYADSPPRDYSMVL